MNPILFVTPFISAFVGYTTNWIAIVMLFRPYNDYKFGPIKLFGKGVIPKNQQKIAKSIGKTVAKELFSTNDLIKQLHSEEINRMITTVIEGKTSHLLSYEYTNLLSLFPAEIRSDWQKIKTNIVTIVQKKLSESAQSGILQKSLEHQLEKGIEYLASQEIIIPKDIETTIGKAIDSQFEVIWNHVKESDIIDNLIGQFLYHFSQKTSSLDEIMPDEIQTTMMFFEDKIADKTVEALTEFFEKEEIRDILKTKLKDGVSKFLETMNLGMFASFLPLDSIMEKMDSVADQISQKIGEFIASETGREQVHKILHEKIYDFLTQPITEWMYRLDTKFVHAVQENLIAFIKKEMEDAKAKPAIKLKLKQQIFDQLTSENICNWLHENKRQTARNICHIMEKNDFLSDENYAKLAMTALTKMEQFKIGKLDQFITNEQRQHVIAFANKGVQNILKNNLPSLFHAIDIQSVVTTKVAEFPLPKLEKIIRDVANRELKFITIFGGILGFCIGLFQLFIFWIASF